jgi:hypothetical protein
LILSRYEVRSLIWQRGREIGSKIVLKFQLIINSIRKARRLNYLKLMNANDGKLSKF